MNDYLLEAREELKRLEHIIYVSLKYTRTVDVITNALNRMINTYDLIIEAFLEKAKEDGLIDTLPKSPALRATHLLTIYPNDTTLKKYLEFYTFLKNFLKQPFQKKEEFRRHVARILEMENATAEVNIDNLVNCEKFIHKFFTYAWTVIVGAPEEDQNII